MESGRKKKLSRLPVDTLLEILNLSGHLPSMQYRQFMKLKEIRNEVIHDAKLVTRSDAEVCIGQSELLLKDNFGIGRSDQVDLALAV